MKTSFETLVLLQTTMKTGGVSPFGLGVGVLLPELVVFLVVAVEALDRPFQLGGKLGLFVELLGLPAFSGRCSRMRSQSSR